MSVEQIFQSLSHDQRIQVVDLTLPGIEAFLKDVLAKENLSEEVESLRCQYVKLLDESTRRIDDDSIDVNQVSPLKTPQIKESVFAFNHEQSAKEDVTNYTAYSDCKQPVWPRNSRKGTDSTEESGVFFGTQSSQITSENQENNRLSDTFESTSSKDTFMSDSEMEFLEWESDLNFIEDGYSTGDNTDGLPPNMNVQPNELGEIYAGVLYIREQPGWHKRWFIVTETCLKCYKYKSDEKMLFEIPLRDAQFVSTDRKRSRMYPITLSIAILKDKITFATTEEKSRQEWIYVINHVIKKISEIEQCTSNKTNNFKTTLDQQEVSDLQNVTKALDEDDASFKRKTWHAESHDGVMNLRVGDEEEAAEQETLVPPTLAQEETFKELQECLPDILYKSRSKSWKGDLSKIDNAQRNNANRKNISFKPEVDSRAVSHDSTTLPRVKRHGSLANSLTNKAARVRSKLTTSFFKKGKKDDKAYLDNTLQSTTFSGYLMRKKGNIWKNRWCVVRDKSLYCYKEFGAALPELELTLEGCSVVSVPEKEANKSCAFLLAAEKDRLLFSAENDAELEEWLELLEKEVLPDEKEDDEIDDEINIYPTNQFYDNGPSSPLPHIEIKGADEETVAPKNNQEKETAGGSVKRSSFLEAIAHKLGKHSSKGKDAPEQKIDLEEKKDLQQLESASGPAMEGILYHLYEANYIQSKVKLSNHCLDIEPLNDSNEVTKFRLLNCIVLDCTDTEGPLVMVVKRNIGKPLYLQAHTEEEYSLWKSAILAASLTTPSAIERVISSESLFDKDDVFLKTSESTTDNIRSSLKPCTYSDVDKQKLNTLKRAYSAGGIDRLKSLSRGYLVYSKRKQSPLRRTISNVLSSLDLSAPQKRRSKTFSGLGVNASLLVGIKYSSCLSLRITNELWSRRWCVLQQNNLHFFVNPDDITPKSSIQLAGCVAEQTHLEGKKFTFQLSTMQEKIAFHFAAQSERETLVWIDLLNAEGQRPAQVNKEDLNLLNGVLLTRVKSESNIETQSDSIHPSVESKSPGKEMRKMSKSLVELRKIRKAQESSNEESSAKQPSNVQSQKPTSLQDVLQLLQEQQLMQSMGHQRYIRVKKARGNWKKSAAAALKESNSQPESPETLKKKKNVEEESQDKSDRDAHLDNSSGSGHSVEHANTMSGVKTSQEYLGKCNQLAEEERLKALKTETLLRKRRNSLSLEKEVLEKKLGKSQDKKTGVKKLLGKEVSKTDKNQDDIIRTKKRLDEINLKLAHVDQDMQENKTKEAAVIDNITVLKTKGLRRLSGCSDSMSERRAKYRESPTGSTSSRDSFEDKKSLPERTASLHRIGSKKTGQASLIFEQELKTVSTNPSRRKKYGSGKRVSSSSEGSFEEVSLKESPSTNRSSLSEVRNDYGLSQSHDKLFGWDNMELKQKGHAGTSPYQEEMHSLTVVEQDGTDSCTTSTASKTSENHRPSLITALSQIKDFEEFLEINRRR